MTKTAVLVRGQARTWNYIAENNISLINKTYDNPDWFLVFPETTTVTEESIKNNFKDSNLISIQFVKDENYKLYGNDNNAVAWRKFPPAYFRQAYFEYHAGRVKRQHEIETGKRYNRVLAIRPDSYFFPDIVPSKHPLEDQDLIGFSSSYETTQDLTGADFQFLAGHRAADLMSFRYLDSRYTDGLRSQALHPGDLESPQYYIKKNLIMQPEAKRGILSSRIVRPNQIAIVTTLTQAIAQSEPYLNDIIDWDTSSVEKRIKWCEKYQIDPQDYFLKRDFTKIS